MRHALRMSLRVFAEHLGIGTRTVSKWEAGGGAVCPRPEMQAILDTALTRAGPEAQALFKMLASGATTTREDDTNRRAATKAIGLAVATAGGGLVASNVGQSRAKPDEEYVQWLAWMLWQQKLDAIHESGLPPSLAKFLQGRDTRSGHILRSPDGSYSFAHPGFVDFYVAQRMFGGIVAGDPSRLAVAQTTHGTDMLIREFVLRYAPSIHTLTTWMQDGATPVVRVNSAGILAKLGSIDISNGVSSSLRSDRDTEHLYLTAVVNRVLPVGWDEADHLAGSLAGRGEAISPTLPTDRMTELAAMLAREIDNPRDSAARWCSVILLSRLAPLVSPQVVRSALQRALHTESCTENLRAIGLALTGESPHEVG